MKVLVIGRKRNGKGEFSSALGRHIPDCDVRWTSQYLVHRLALINGFREEVITSNKEYFRDDMIALGNKMCDVDPGCLVSICLFGSRNKNVIVDGVRRVSEFEAVKDWFDTIVWVERPDIEIDEDDNMELNKTMADKVVFNTGTIQELNIKARNLFLEIT